MSTESQQYFLRSLERWRGEQAQLVMRQIEKPEALQKIPPIMVVPDLPTLQYFKKNRLMSVFLWLEFESLW